MIFLETSSTFLIAAKHSNLDSVYFELESRSQDIIHQSGNEVCNWVGKGHLHCLVNSTVGVAIVNEESDVIGWKAADEEDEEDVVRLRRTAKS